MLQMLTRIPLRSVRRPAPPPETVRAAQDPFAGLDAVERTPCAVTVFEGLA